MVWIATCEERQKKLMEDAPAKKNTRLLKAKQTVSQKVSKEPFSTTLGLMCHFPVALPYSPKTTTAITPLTSPVLTQGITVSVRTPG